MSRVNNLLMALRSQSERDTYNKAQQEKAGKNTQRVITGYAPGRRIGGGGGNERAKDIPIYAYVPKQPQSSPQEQQQVKSYGNAPSSQGVSSIDFDKQLAAIRSQNQASMDALTKQLEDQAADYALKEEAANKKISGLASTVANAQSRYDPTKDMQSSNNINPALTIQEKDKSLSSGTQRYNRNKLSINNLNV